MIEKRTIRRAISLSGVGVHSGAMVRLTLKPSTAGTIVFRRTDLGGLDVPLDPRRIDASRRSALLAGNASVQTVEHLLAVLSVLGIDSLDVELDGGEIPIFDGSAEPLARALVEAGVEPLPEKRKAVRIVRPFLLKDGDASLAVLPDDDFRLSYRIEFPHPAIRTQSRSLRLTRRAFLEEIAPARTFGFLKDIPELRRQGLTLGGSPANALVLDDEKVINGPLRFPDEFVRHKLLDLIGDLALFGAPLLGHFQADRAGHALHVRAVRFLLDAPDSWRFDASAAPGYLADTADHPCQRRTSELK
jgi:UDP-3-O-[3-hydroxymyristoyl] N-acetylglucosamine deacetylase